MVNRRGFLKLTAVGVLSLFVAAHDRRTQKVSAAARTEFTQVKAASIPGGTLDPNAVPKYVTPLLIPPAMPRAGKLTQKAAKNVDYYEIAVRQFEQQILPAGLPATTVWGYGPAAAQNGPAIFNAPSLTIEAKANRPVRVKWINDLKDANGDYLPHLLPVDQTLHWANPPGGMDGRDTRPTFEETPGTYTGPVPVVTHVHGAVNVGDESDGYAEAWYLPAANDIPEGYATTGRWYDFFANKAKVQGFLAKGTTDWEPGTSVFQYPNTQRASTIWYHDHTLGMTRTNVYAGPAGFYIIRGGPSDMVLDSRTSLAATLPGPAPALGDLPGTVYYEIPIAIQDRSFNSDGSLFYPDSRAFFEEHPEEIPGYIPDTDLSPIWNPEFFGNMIMVNGNTWPYLDVEQRRYRFRVLNGCNSRFLYLDFNDIPGVQVWQIGNEGGYLAAPVDIMALGGRLLMGLAERADIIVDFTNVPVGSHVLGNVGPDEPFGGGEPGDDFDMADPDSTGQVMQFNVGPALTPDTSTTPEFLVLPAIAPLPAPVRTRKLALIEIMSEYFDAPAEAMLGIVDDTGTAMHKMWSEPISENPYPGETEVWEFYNFTADAHPMHIHEVVFQVIDRQPITFEEEMGHIMDVELDGSPRPPEPWENGWKDTVIAYPGEVTRMQMRFEKSGQYVWHCHIVEHEDNEMMRPYRIGPEQPNQPMPPNHEM